MNDYSPPAVAAGLAAVAILAAVAAYRAILRPLRRAWKARP